MANTRLQASLSRIRGWGTAQVNRAYRVHKRVGEAIAENLIIGGRYSSGTPLDTGAARDSWTETSDGAGARAFSETPRDSMGFVALGEARAKIQAARKDAKIGFASACPYMEKLEDGSSQQAPQGFIKQIVSAFPAIVQDASREVKLERGGRG